MIRQGYLVQNCAHCGHPQKVWVDLDRGNVGWTCKECGKWSNILVIVTSVDPAEQRGEKSPAWGAAVELFNFVPDWARPSHYEEVFSVKPGTFKESDGAPFVSESFLYCTIGKEDARTLRALLRDLLEATGINMWEVECEAARRSDRAQGGE
jgi:hypothetical protein